MVDLFSEYGFLRVEELYDDDEDEPGVKFEKAIKMGKLSLSMSYKGGMGEFKPDLFFRIMEDNMISVA